MEKIVFSLDSNCLNRPELVGINIDKLSKSKFIKIFSDAYLFRKHIKNISSPVEVWVLSSDNIEAINLAAAVKKDKPHLNVKLISFTYSGSLQSRANAANIDSVLNIASLKDLINDSIAKNEKDLINSNINHSSKENLKSSKTDKLDNDDVNYNTDKQVNKKQAIVIPVMSASGGAGKSTVTVAAGILAQASGYKTLLIDGDFQFGDISILSGCSQPLRIDQLIAEKNLIYSLKSNKNIPAIVGPPVMAELSEKILEEFPQLLDYLRSYYDVIIINTGSLWVELQAVLLEKCTKTLFLVDQRPTSINATNRAIDLCGRCGIAIGSVLFAINKCSKTALFTSVDVSCALRGVTVAEIFDGGMDVDEFLAYGKPLELLKSKNSLIVSLWSILKEILPKKDSGPKHAVDLSSTRNKKRFFGLFGKKSA